jgi:hypothetical protein
MDAERDADVQTYGPLELTSIDKGSTALEAKSWSEHLSRLPELCRKQTSEIELEEARKRGCYRVLPPVVAPHENEPPMCELLQEIDEEVMSVLLQEIDN